MEGLATKRRYLIAVDCRATVVIAVARLYHGRVLVLHHVPLRDRRVRLLLLLLFFVFLLFLLLLLLLLMLLMVVVMVMVVRVLLVLLVLVLLHFVGTRVVWSQVERFLSLAQLLR